jgi:hypothetical protein
VRIAIPVLPRWHGAPGDFLELAVADGDLALSAGGDGRVMGNDEQRGAGPAQAFEQVG